MGHLSAGPGMIENRLRALRLARGFTQQHLAKLTSTSPAQIQRLETGSRRLTLEWVDRLSEALRCDPSELLRRTLTVPVIGHFTIDGEVTWLDPARDTPEAVEAPPGIDPRRVAALRAVGILNHYCSLLYFTRNAEARVSECVNHPSVIQLPDGRSFVRLIVKGTERGKWTLNSLFAPPIEDVEISWAAPVEWLRP